MEQLNLRASIGELTAHVAVVNNLDHVGALQVIELVMDSMSMILLLYFVLFF